MKVNIIKKSFLNVSGKIYNSEFINLANIMNDKISLDDRTLFLTETEKELLNKQKIERYDNAVYVFKYNNRYGMVGDLPISEYNINVKCHELVIPDIVQGMLSNLNSYNCETAPILLAYDKKIDYLYYIKNKKYKRHLVFEQIEIYIFCDEEAKILLSEFNDIEKLYVADGHHRLYTTSLSNLKDSVLSCLISFEDLDILPIHRIIHNVREEEFNNAKKFIYNKFNIIEGHNALEKGKVRLKYKEEQFIIDLIELNSDAFWNNDIYRLNTQVISQAFRIFDTGELEYILGNEFSNKLLGEDDVLIETYPIEKKEFIECANNNCIMPPKSTCFSPKFPSFLVFKKYK